MKRSDSIVIRLTALVFILLLLTIAILLILVNNQMNNHFSQYLTNMSHMMGNAQNGMGMGMSGMHGSMHGPAESTYISAVHQSLLWVGIGMIIVSVIVSYFVVREIMRPLSTLTGAVQKIRTGSYGQTVSVERHDEVGVLTESFNEMSEELARNDKMRRQLFANIAHELRTPLAILQGNLEGMIDDIIPTDKKILLSMADETVRMGRLIQDLRDLSLAEIDELTLHKEPADINTMLERAVSMLQPLCEEKSLTVRQNLSRDLPSLVIDVDRINQVIYNLLNNAIRYIDKGCTITVSTMKVAVEGKPYVQVQVADTGKGIAPEDLNHIFQYFYRSEQSRNRKSGGSGIGLALAQQFIRSHGGNIWADSTVGKGTTFTFILPLKAEI
ncbi:cell wall metabolism sensor histidine kinase WalK [Megasphaera sp. DISK 18]|uniref:sensor histidine kinase n=1 Tax=Megasphaera sp. DISK 18 TaxID=1776081 RepID=UPI0008070246|nr:ATP-binding protein [Megasphaera sp. DISK 18]OBZ33568.1 two-component sensor histidine kinase [Megasphaera sp. DISK 18]